MLPESVRLLPEPDPGAEDAEDVESAPPPAAAPPLLPPPLAIAANPIVVTDETTLTARDAPGCHDSCEAGAWGRVTGACVAVEAWQ